MKSKSLVSTVTRIEETENHHNILDGKPLGKIMKMLTGFIGPGLDPEAYYDYYDDKKSVSALTRDIFSVNKYQIMYR
jgi:hypothetical protein